ncbi:alpha/beta hydrolase family protein [Metabacillus halosaccharovorans]|uniref:Alpha/beta hydrolase n=1 Tax=Metabacillus halosaccharovorans TaxID=930124 RepID=A0ABT3DGG2_9BACI|nr:alpha/beta hydrolase [Metabacillus halosaccharovorans]MCV9886147.1 alpha/beta hydrolase [Metabacillus halosaccharovorans]
MSTIREEEVSIIHDITLKGTMAFPSLESEKHPAIILINGSGSSDRDGNMKKPAIQSDLYKELAHFLTGLGFITLRYDKRSVGESEGDPIKSGMLDLVRDVQENIQYLKNHPKVDHDRILLLGHSEGCIIGTIAHQQIPVAGLILLAGAASNIEEPMAYQNQQVIEEIKHLKGIKGMILRKLVTESKVEKQAANLKRKVEQTQGDTMRYQLKKMPIRWFREHYFFSTEMIINILKDAQCPILAITGDKDVQANPENVKRIEQLEKPNTTAIVIENMDHMLKEFHGERTILNLLKQYKKEAKDPIHYKLKEELKDWLIINYL